MVKSACGGPARMDAPFQSRGGRRGSHSSAAQRSTDASASVPRLDDARAEGGDGGGGRFWPRHCPARWWWEGM